MVNVLLIRLSGLVSQREEEDFMMSGAAQGMYWTNRELTDIQVGDEYEPGHYRTMTLPDPEVMLDAMLAAYRMSKYAALKYSLYAGADIEAQYGLARHWLADNIALKPGADPKVRQRLAADGDA